MKKISLILILVILALPLVFADSYTDFSRPYIQQKCYSGGTGDCYTNSSYLFRSTDQYTNIDYTDPSWDSCSVLLGGTKNRGVPISFYDYNSAYEHFSFLVLDDSSLKQYASDCSIVDEYVFLGFSISKLGVINKGFVSNDSNIPYFAFAYDKISDNKTYISVLTLDSSTSKLKFLYDVDIGEDWGEYDDIMGLAGGQSAAIFNSAPSSTYYFGMYSRYNDKLVMIHDWDDDGRMDDTLNLSNFTQYNDISGQKDMYFDDWNADGWNEFILLTSYNLTNDFRARYELNYITPLELAPYYIKESDTYTDQVTGLGSDNGRFDSEIKLCNIGGFSSELEACANFRKNSSTAGSMSISSYIIHNDFDSSTNIESHYASRIDVWNLKPFSMLYDSELVVCLPIILSSATKYEYTCYDGTYNTIFSFNTSISTIKHNASSSLKHIYSPEMIVSEVDGNISTTELLYSNGVVETLTINGTNTAITSWNTLFDYNNIGDMFIQDISGDDRSELIYIDDNLFKIYSNDNTPFTFLSPEDYYTFTTTTTTTPSTTTTTIKGQQAGVPVVFTRLQNNIELIIGLIIIFALGFIGATYTNGNVLMGGLGAIIGAVISLTLGLIGAGVMIIIVIGIIGLAILGLTIMNKSGN